MLLALLVLLSLGACGKHPAPVASELSTPPPSFKVALLTPGPVADAGWNAAAYEGLRRIQTQLGAQTALVQTTSPADFDDAFRDFGMRGFQLIFAHGFEYTDAAIKAGQQFPRTWFVVSSGSRIGANVASLSFNMEEATYLEGRLAGAMTRTGVAGAVGGVELPAIALTFECFKRGFLAARPNGKVLISYTGSFEDLGAAKEAALAQVSRGADFLLHDADAAGLGVLQAAAERKVFAFGAFRDQNQVAPTVTLASAVLDVPAAFVKIAREVQAGRFHAARLVFGLKDHMVKLVFNPRLQDRIPASALEQMRAAQSALVSGKLVLPDAGG